MDLLDQSLGHVARSIAGATRLFNQCGLDFCCGGKQSLRFAIASKGLDADAIVAQLDALQAHATAEGRDWSAAPPAELISHIVSQFHDRHRDQFPELIRLARKVEQVHGDRPACPHGLADHLASMQQELESHMQKEEQVLFPLLARGPAGVATGPITVMRMEHEQHGDALQRLATLTNDITLPSPACNTWRALYMGLRAFRDDLMEHIHLENNILFDNAAACETAHA